MKLILLTLIFITSTLSFAQIVDPVVATVNGKKITKSTLLSYHKQNLNFVQAAKKVTMTGSLNDLIDRIIGIESAKKASLHKRSDVVKKMNDIVYHAYISDQLAPKLNKIRVTKKQIKSYYNDNPEYKTSQVLLRLRTLPSPEDVGKAITISKQIHTQVKKNPKNFAKIAAKYSQADSALRGGDMGYLPRVRLPIEYYQAIKGKKAGYISNPIRSQYGIHVIMVTGVKKYKQIEQKLYKKIVYDSKRDALLVEYFKAQRNQAKVTIHRKEINNE